MNSHKSFLYLVAHHEIINNKYRKTENSTLFFPKIITFKINDDSQVTFPLSTFVKCKFFIFKTTDEKHFFFKF